MFRTFPTTNRLWRFCLSAKHDLVFQAFKTTALGGLVRSALQKWLRNYMQSTAPSEYHDIVIPDYELGGKRFVLDHGYLSSLHDPRVKLLRSPSLTVIEPRKVQTETGETFPADVIIFANGFKTQELLTPMTITGQDGATLPDLWHEEGNFPSAYMGSVISTQPPTLPRPS
jgi:cation diffusion facilitator CzcD-associated flavoprotein CzcO